MEQQPLPERCVIRRFRENPGGFLIDANYPCDVLRENQVRICGRVIIPCILESGEKGFVPDSFSRQCAASTYDVGKPTTSIDTKHNKYFGIPPE